MSTSFETRILDDEFYETERQVGLRASQGDTGCVETMYELHSSRLHHTLHRSFGGYPPAEDLTQETFTKALAAIENNQYHYRGPGTMYGWLLRIATNAGITARRKNERMLSTDFQDARFDHAASGDFTEAIADDDLITQILSTLSPERKDIVQAVVIEGQSYNQYSENNGGLSIGTISSRLYRARSDLRATTDPHQLR